MNDLLSWKNTSLKIDSKIDENAALIEILKNKEISLRKDDSEYTLVNQEFYYIFEDEFINQSKNLNEIITKYVQKNYDKLCQVYMPDMKVFRDIEAISKDKNTDLVILTFREENLSIYSQTLSLLLIGKKS